MIRKSIIFSLVILLGISIADGQTWNNPHRSNGKQNTRYSAFAGAPKTLDPARAYSSDETQFIAQIYEPPLQYHYLKRPFTLIPLTARKMPEVTYYDKQGHPLPSDTNPQKVAYTIYDIYITPGIYYQPHPAFAKDAAGNYHYHHLSKENLDDVHQLSDFKYTGTRELTADDYIYQIKRLAHPKLQSPILGLMGEHILGLKDYAKRLQALSQPFIDLRQYPLTGVKRIDKYHYQIIIKGIYPQFKYWLAMSFFAPIPWEADYFYSQPGMAENNISFDWYPVGTGPYMLIQNNPNKQMVLGRNPNFHAEKYPSEGEPGDRGKGYLKDAGKKLPFIDLFIFSLDKESIPRWNKFLQGYYDKSGISTDSFDQAIKIDRNGKPIVTKALKEKNIVLQTAVTPAIYYIGFNMLDPVVGGHSEKQQKLRQAIAIAIDYEEFISIFMNGRGVAAHGPIPPGIFGFRKDEQGINPVVYTFQNGKAIRKPIEAAQKLLAEAGYSGGIDPETKAPLILNYDVASQGSPDDKARFDWMRKQFAKLGIRLNIRATQYNRFQDKVRTGSAQIFSWGWLADYPDPENFLFLLYGPNAKVKHGGENAANYDNLKVNILFEQIKNLPNGPSRQAKIDELIKIIRQDNPWIWGMHPIDFTLSHAWNRPTKPHAIANNTLKYERLNPKIRYELRKEWNKPVLWPLWVLIAFLILLFLPLTITYLKREHKPTIKRFNQDDKE